MGTASSDPIDFRLALDDSPSDSYEMSKVLLAKAAFDGTLQLLTSGWEQCSADAAVAAILDSSSTGPVDLRVRCRNGLGKYLRLHRQYDEHEHVMYIVAEEVPGNAPGVGVRRRTEERRSALRQA